MHFQPTVSWGDLAQMMLVLVLVARPLQRVVKQHNEMWKDYQRRNPPQLFRQFEELMSER